MNYKILIEQCNKLKTTNGTLQDMIYYLKRQEKISLELPPLVLILNKEIRDMCDAVDNLINKYEYEGRFYFGNRIKLTEHILAHITRIHQEEVIKDKNKRE